MTQENGLKELHHWPVLALSCIDGRFIERTIEFIGKECGPVFDYRTEVGCSKALLDCEDDCERFFNVIETSVRLHSVKEVWLIDHIDCGAYGGSKSFDDIEAEKDFHKEQLQKAALKVNKNFPSLVVKAIFADWDKIEAI